MPVYQIFPTKRPRRTWIHWAISAFVESTNGTTNVKHIPLLECICRPDQILNKWNVCLSFMWSSKWLADMTFGLQNLHIICSQVVTLANSVCFWYLLPVCLTGKWPNETPLISAFLLSQQTAQQLLSIYPFCNVFVSHNKFWTNKMFACPLCGLAKDKQTWHLVYKMYIWFVHHLSPSQILWAFNTCYQFVWLVNVQMSPFCLLKQRISICHIWSPICPQGNG